MEVGMMLCMRCYGRKELYKVGSCYSHTNTGGVLTKCPLCLGAGKIKKIEALSGNELDELSKSLNHARYFKDEILDVKLNPKNPENVETLIEPSVHEIVVATKKPVRKQKK